MITGFNDVKAAALSAGALGVSISGAGSSVFAISDDAKKAKKIGAEMAHGFAQHHVVATVRITKIDHQGVRQVR